METKMETVVRSNDYFIVHIPTSLSLYKLKYFINKQNIFFSLQDQLAADMYNFSSKEGEYACYYVMVNSPLLSSDASEFYIFYTNAFLGCII